MEYSEEFETFWKKYPSRWNTEIGGYVKRKKWPAFEKWQKLSQAIRNDCLAKSRLIRLTGGTPRDCVTWLNQRGWDDIELPTPKRKVIDSKLVPTLKTVPIGDIRSTSDKVNVQRGKLGIR